VSGALDSGLKNGLGAFGRGRKLSLALISLWSFSWRDVQKSRRLSQTCREILPIVTAQTAD